MNSLSKRFVWLVPLFLIVGCRTIPVQPPVAPVVATPATKIQALIPLAGDDVPRFVDDASTVSLRTASLSSVEYFKGLPPTQVIKVGPDSYTAKDLLDSAQFLSDLVGTPGWLERVRTEFQVYQSTGKDAAKTVTFSSYYEASLSARLTPDAVYRYPIYGRPADLIDVDLGQFDPVWQGARIAGRQEGRKLVPYPTRADIDSKGLLKTSGIEIAWAKDPVDIFFLQVEGSGWLDLGNGEKVRIRFDGHNGRRYGSVGLHLIETGRVKKATFNHASFVAYMRDHPKERQSLLNFNERYVFFRLDRGPSAAYALGNISVPLTPGRSIATDPKLFPKGAIAWMDLPDSPSGAMKRFVMNQDEGGAIQGPARVDFFVGDGKEAETFAFQLWHPGKLYVLVKKKNSPASRY